MRKDYISEARKARRFMRDTESARPENYNEKRSGVKLRIMYTARDGRLRVNDTNRVKFMEDGFQETDKPDEHLEDIKGPIIVAHVYRARGGKRLTFEVPEGFDMELAKRNLLEHGWLDLSACILREEVQYQ